MLGCHSAKVTRCYKYWAEWLVCLLCVGFAARTALLTLCNDSTVGYSLHK